MEIDINYDFWKDVNYDRKRDPDKESKTLWTYHSMLWKKGVLQGLQKAKDYLEVKVGGETITLGADNFEALYRKHKKYESKNEESEKIKRAMSFRPEWKYVIGGSLLFPNKIKNGVQTINQIRGMRAKIADRIDITLLCIKLWYEKKENCDNPLWDSLEKNKTFFNLFKNFEGYVDFFFMNDFVNDDYEPINLFDENREKLGEEVLEKKKNNYPKDYKEWENLYKHLRDCIEKRSKRIWKHLTNEENVQFDIEQK